jgi:hypothetical protein
MGFNYTPISFPANRAMALYTAELFVKSPCLHPLFGPAFTPYPLFQWYPQSNEILLNLSVPPNHKTLQITLVSPNCCRKSFYLLQCVCSYGCFAAKDIPAIHNRTSYTHSHVLFLVVSCGVLPVSHTHPIRTIHNNLCTRSREFLLTNELKCFRMQQHIVVESPHKF